MIDQNKRELMRQAYKLLEDFEQTVNCEAYWDRLRDACESFCKQWQGDLHDFAFAQAAGIWDLLEADAKKGEANV